MVTVVKTPQGHKIIDQAVAAAITEDYVGDAVVTLTGHSLTTGDTVYITSDIDEYNGFWYVTTITVDTFKISEHSAADFVEYYQDADIEYYQTQPHDWSSIFLPIVYKATNNLWPVNTSDPALTVSSFSDDNGFTQVTLSGILHPFVNALEFVKVSGMSDEDYNGVWQIVEVINGGNVVLNLPYADDLSFSGATIQYYYNNYQTKVKIYSGLPADHPWHAKKPYAEVAELSLTPDENNEVMFSVADYIQGQVNIRNNPTLFSMPLNLDAFTGFYIATAETYDSSDGYSLYTTDALFVDNSFEGYAIAGKLPFKNVYSGDYADYVYTSGSPAQWLTNRLRLLAVEGYYFDVSFIKNVTGAFNFIIDKYAGSYLSSTEVIPYEDFGKGVYRLPITPDANYDSVCVRVNVDPVGGSPAPDDPTLGALSTFTNLVTPGPGNIWTTGAVPNVRVPDSQTGKYLVGDFEGLAGYDFTFSYEYTLKPELEPTMDQHWRVDVYIDLLNAVGAVLDSFSEHTEGVLTVDVVKSGTIILTPPADTAYIGVRMYNDSDNFGFEATRVLELNDLTFDGWDNPGGTDPTPEADITEEICIDILETCEIEGGFTPETARRLTEDGGYRLLE